MLDSLTRGLDHHPCRGPPQAVRQQGHGRIFGSPSEALGLPLPSWPPLTASLPSAAGRVDTVRPRESSQQTIRRCDLGRRMVTIPLSWREIPLGRGRSSWVVPADTGEGPKQIAKGTTLPEALEKAVAKLGYTILDRADWPPGKIAHFRTSGNLARNVAVLRTGLHSLYKEVKALETELPQGIHSAQDFDVNGNYAMLAIMFDWFSISTLNLMEGVSLLDTLAREGADYVDLSSRDGGMESIRNRAKKYTKSIPEAGPLRQWRNKVAAHRSGILPPPRGRGDSMATKLISLMGAQVMAKNGRYVAPAGTPGGAALGSASSELQEWSLTATWESLANRRFEWLNDRNFFKDLNKIHMGGTACLYSFSLVSGDAAVRELLMKQGIKRPSE